MEITTGRDTRILTATLLAGAIVAGLTQHKIAYVFSPYILDSLFFIVVFSLLPYAATGHNKIFVNDPIAAVIVAWQQFVVPSIVFVVGIVFGIPEMILAFLIVSATAGALFASATFAAILSLDQERTIRCMVWSTISMPVSLFVFLGLVRGPDLDLHVGNYLGHVFQFLVIPFGVKFLYGAIAPSIKPQVKVRIHSFANWGAVVALMVFIMGVMDGVHLRWETNPALVISYFFIALTLGVATFALTLVVMARFGRQKAMTAGVLAAFRNVGLSLALVGDMFGSDLLVFVGVTQIPAFIAPLILLLLERRQFFKLSYELPDGESPT